MAPNNPIEFMVPMSDDLISTHTIFSIFSAFTIACTEHETCVPFKVQVRNHNAAPLEMYALLEKCNKRALLNQCSAKTWIEETRPLSLNCTVVSLWWYSLCSLRSISEKVCDQHVIWIKRCCYTQNKPQIFMLVIAYSAQIIILNNKCMFMLEYRTDMSSLFCLAHHEGMLKPLTVYRTVFQHVLKDITLGN